MKRPCSATPGQPDSASILAIGPNPALQKTISFSDGWSRDCVNRASRVAYSVGGKGQQFALAAARYFSSMSAASDEPYSNHGVALAQILGGSTGTEVATLLEASGLPRGCQITVEVAGDTRTCTTLIDGRRRGTATELIDPSSPVSAEKSSEFKQAVLSAISTLKPACVACCGTMPPGLSESLYADVYAKARGNGAVTLLDGCSASALAALSGGSISILKVNREELARINVAQGAADDSGTVPQHATSIFRRTEGLGWIAVTNGSGQSFLLSKAQGSGRAHTCWRFDIPSLDSIIQKANLGKATAVNPIGAGDTAAAVLLCKIAEGLEVPAAFQWALAAASAHCVSGDSARFHPAVARIVHSNIAVRCSDASHADTLQCC